MRRILAFAIAALLLAACAPRSQPPQVSAADVDAEGRQQQDLAFREHMARMDRLDRVAWAMLARNVELCGGNTAYSLGVGLRVLDDVPKGMHGAASRTAGIRSRPTVYALAPGGAGDASGLRRGDVVLAVDGEAPGTRRQAEDMLRKAVAVEKAGAPVRLLVERDGQPLELTLAPQRICAYDVLLVNDPELNAYADGRRIVVNTGMMRFVRSDDELAAILGHELAHNTQGHIDAKKNNRLLGALLFDLPIALLTGYDPAVGSRVGGQMYSQEFETEADYVGLYYTFRAGYDIDNVPDIWRRMGVENPGAITLGSSHPSTASRFVALEAARDEIKGKAASGQPLHPRMKQDK